MPYVLMECCWDKLCSSSLNHVLKITSIHLLFFCLLLFLRLQQQNEVIYRRMCFLVILPGYSASNEQSVLISFRIDWFDFLAIQGILKSLLQHYRSKTSILWHSAFFTVQLSYLSMTAGKIIALTRWIFVSKVKSLLYNILSIFVIGLGSLMQFIGER